MVFDGGGKEIVHYHDTDLGTTALHEREREREREREMGDDRCHVNSSEIKYLSNHTCYDGIVYSILFRSK